jgi:Na+-translocating ferredoxin:NAD+ oxidoreductase subunit B
MMKENTIYVDLCRHLNQNPIGAPQTEQILEILKLKFSPDEARLALCLDIIPQPIDQIAESSGQNEETVLTRLEEMADKGLVMKINPVDPGNPSAMYSLLPTMPGLFETTFGKGEVNPKARELAKLWQEYYRSGFGKEIHSSKTPITRVISVHQSIGDARTTILPHEKASEFLNTAGYFSVTHCACRHSANLEGNGCDKPVDVCMHFEDFGRYLVERGYAREISREEALSILEKTKAAGLVHVTANFQEKCIVLCSCCPCCCFQLKGILALKKAGAVARSRFVPHVNPDMCIACGECESRCYFTAMRCGDNGARVNPEDCIGCGLCAANCPEQAISMMERDDYQTPCPDMISFFTTILTEKAPFRS